MIALDDLCEFIVDCEHKTAPIQEDGYPSIRTPNIGRGRFFLQGVNRVSEQTYIGWTKRAIPRGGDLILAREAPVGNVAVIPEGEKFCLGQRTVLIRPDREKVDPDYLCYLLLTPEMQGMLLGKSGGATVHHLNMKDIRALDIRDLPCLDKQRQHALIIKNYDDLIIVNESRIALLEESARLLYREWFVNLRFPGYDAVSIKNGVPEGWSLRALSDVAPLNYGKALKAESRKDGEIPVYGSSGVVGYHNLALVEAGAIIVGRKGNVGSLYYSATPCFPIDTVFYIEPKAANYRLFLAMHGLNFISSDAAVPGLNRNYAHSLPLLIPSEEVTVNFETLITPLFNQIEQLKQQIVRLSEARNLFLPKLMSGEIQV